MGSFPVLFHVPIYSPNTAYITWDHNVLVAVELERSIYSVIMVKQAVMINIQNELKRVLL